MKGIEKVSEEKEKKQDESLKFQDLLVAIRAVDSKDRAKFLIDAINNSLEDLLLSIEKHRKSGQLNITLKIDVAKDEEFNTKIFAQVDVKKPKGEASPTELYRDPKGKLYNEKAESQPVVDIRTRK